MKYTMLVKKIDKYNEKFENNFKDFLEDVHQMCILVSDAMGVNTITVPYKSFFFYFNRNELEIATKDDLRYRITRSIDYSDIENDDITSLIANWNVIKKEIEKKFEEEFLKRLSGENE